MINKTEKEIMKNWKGDLDAPLVSVHMITYNHQEYIGDAIEGVLIQETDFPFELIIGDDCSTDETIAVIKQYHIKYPNIIKPIFREKNIGMNKNAIDVFNKCEGKYIAMCEGDDYWIDPLKLQKQVDFLEQNKAYSLCYGRAYKLDVEQELVPIKLYKRTNIFNIYDLAKHNFIPTATAMIRKSCFCDLINIDFPIIDRVMWLLAAQTGAIYRFSDFFSIYRIHNVGIWSLSPIITKTTTIINNYIAWIGYFKNDKKLNNILKSFYVFHSIQLLILYLKHFSFKKALLTYIDSFKYGVRFMHVIYPYIRLSRKVRGFY